MTVSVEIKEIGESRYQVPDALTWVGEAKVSYAKTGKPNKTIEIVVTDRLGWGRGYAFMYKESERAVSSEVIYQAIVLALREKLPEPRY